ncbi:helix-turn-helix domain-containing protein [Actinoplanes sp. L3-i22]|uniref:AraC-like ligand-binding domain-containing protein n=1 Tax=Actinoplanes sp. L3-i22 TaxID=2836373 RepID=UPI001C8566AF|nr:helix-turn-helix domain-containing protein [Actinoplanes sp. L3-i22]
MSPADRADFWRTAASKSFVDLSFTVPDPINFRGEIITETIGGVTVSRVTAAAHTAVRTERHIARAHDDGFYKLSMPVRGYVLISQDGREAPLLPGDLAIYDTSRPYQVAFGDTCQMLVLMFPHRDLRLSQRAMGDLTARRVSGRHGIGGLVTPLLVNLVSQIEELGTFTAPRLADNLVDLLTTLYAEQLGEAARPSDAMQVLLMRIRAFIAANLDDADLTPDAIAAACHVSTGYLHKLFRATGTSVGRYIRDRRLEQCRRDLLDPGQLDTAVSTIGAHWGFLDAAHFSRTFKATYGVSPREYRLSRDVFGHVEMAAAADDDPGPR